MLTREEEIKPSITVVPRGLINLKNDEAPTLHILGFGGFVRSDLFTARALPLFEYYRLRPIFEISSILLLIVVLYLYRREKRQVKMIFSRLSQKNFFLDLAIQCGGIYIWEFKDEEFFSSILSVTSRRESSWRRCGN